MHHQARASEQTAGLVAAAQASLRLAAEERSQSQRLLETVSDTRRQLTQTLHAIASEGAPELEVNQLELEDVLERARELHFKRCASVGAAGITAPAGGSSECLERWSMREWLSVAACGPPAEALAAPLELETPAISEFALVQALGELEGERRAGAAKNFVMALLRKGNVLERLADVIIVMAKELLEAKAATGLEMNSKFASDPSTFSFSYGSQCDFFAGLEDLIGSPDPRVEKAMMREHCYEMDSRIKWTTQNYGVTTTPEIEWHFVTGSSRTAQQRRPSLISQGSAPCGTSGTPSAAGDASSVWKWPEETITRNRRQWKDIGDFKEVFEGINAKLKDKGEPPLEQPEWIGARLYTGPMFEKYNAVNRGGAIKGDRQSKLMVTKFQDLCHGNRYCTTIHAINSALIKLSKIEKAGILYRGTQRGVLPECFWKKDESGVRGGIEYGFLSCTKAEDVAKQYVKDGSAQAATIFKIQTGMIDRGADLSPFSQYPHEQEICFPPLTCMEVLDSWIKGSILYIQIRLNVNFSALTIDQVINKRRRLVADMCKNLQSEVSHAVLRYQWTTTVGQYSKEEAEVTSGVVRDLACRKLRSIHEDEAAEHFNSDEKLLSSIRMALEITDSVKWLKSSVLRKAAEHLRSAHQETSAAECADRHAEASSSIECKCLAPITLKREDTRKLGLTLGSGRLHILSALQLHEVAGAIQVQEPHQLFESRGVHQGDTLCKVNEQTDVANLPHELVCEEGAELTFQRSLSSKELAESVVSIMTQPTADAACVDRLVLEVARALALNPLRSTIFLKEQQLDANAGKILARALGTNTTVKDAVLSRNSLGFEASKAMKDMLLQNRTLKSLLIDSNSLGPDGGKQMAEALESNDTLQSLRIGWNAIGEAGGTAVAEAISTNRCLEALNTEFNNLGCPGGKVFGDALCQNAHLLALHIDGNKLGPEGGTAIAIALETNVTLKKLWIPQNELGEEGGRAFARALLSNRALEHLGIADNSIGPEAGAEIAHALKDNECLRSLRIGRNQLGVQGGRAFAEALSANHYLSMLEVNNNNLQAEATIAIASSLRDTNKTLTRFDTENNAIGVEGLQALAGVLEVNNKLKLLSLQGNGIEPGKGDFFGHALGKNRVVTTIWLDGGELSGDAIGNMLKSNATLEVLGFAGCVSSVVIDSIRLALEKNTVSQLQTIHFGSDDGVKLVKAHIEKLKEAVNGITIKIGW